MSNREEGPALGRRQFLAGTASLFGMITVNGCNWQEFFQRNFRRLTREEVDRTVAGLEARYKAKYGKDFVVGAEGPMDGTLFGYALDIQRCIGCRYCMAA
jgi:molybdopterin-containing oxidoreductase family iron-sulfur binding subunit